MSIRGKYTVLIPPTKVRALVRTHLGPPMMEGAERIASDWRRAIPHDWPGQQGFVTGKTALDIRVNRENQTTVAISTGTVSGRSLEEGAKQHLIPPRSLAQGSWYARSRKGGQLPTVRWPEERGGFTMPHDPPGWRVRFVANHPGVMARGYGYLAMVRQQMPILRAMNDALRRIP